MNTASLKQDYQERIVPALVKEFGYTTVMQCPKLEKIVLNQGLGEATADKKIIEVALQEMTTIAGQKAVATLSKKDIAQFKVRQLAIVDLDVSIHRLCRTLVMGNIHDGSPYDMEWDYLTLGGNNSTTYGTGLSLTYKYKSNFMWKVFVDYDYSKKTFTLTYDPLRFMKVTTPDLGSVFEIGGFPLDPYIFEREKKMHYITIGGSFAVNF